MSDYRIVKNGLDKYMVQKFNVSGLGHQHSWWNNESKCLPSLKDAEDYRDNLIKENNIKVVETTKTLEQDIYEMIKKNIEEIISLHSQGLDRMNDRIRELGYYKQDKIPTWFIPCLVVVIVLSNDILRSLIHF